MITTTFLAILKDGRESLQEVGYLISEWSPHNLIRALTEFCKLAEGWLAENESTPFHDELLQFYFDALRFIRTAELFDDHFVTLLQPHATTLVGFAVMGRIFGEGIDLQGQRLIGVVIVGVGLPQLTIENDLIMDHFAESGCGFEFAYQVPGMNRVLQSAGRVIRSKQDRGIICLIDERFADHRYRKLYPDEWTANYVDNCDELANATI